MEEELFGRTDVDSTETELRSTDPMHPSMLSEPMRWLAEAPGRLVPAAGAGWTEAAIGWHFAWTRRCSRSSRRSVLNVPAGRRNERPRTATMSERTGTANG